MAFKTCECGNKIDPRDMGEDATNCEWCEYPSMDWVMWREAVGADWLEQMETHGMDSMYTIDYVVSTGELYRGGKIGNVKSVNVFANSVEIAEYIVGEWLARKEYA